MLRKQPLKNLSAKDLVVVHWTETLDRAFDVLLSSRVRHLPVVEDSGAIVGIISDRDFQRAMQVDQPDFASGKAAQASFDPNAKVRDYMTWPVEAIQERSSIGDAARVMVDKKISSLVVVRGDQVVGIVTTEDLLKAMLNESSHLMSDVQSGLQSALYNSPIGQIAHVLANIGV